MKIYKYTLQITDLQTIMLPVGAHILSVGNQHDYLCLWAMIDPSNEQQARTIEIIGTGNPIEVSQNINRRFIGTAIFTTFVWHVFERTQQ